MSEEKEGKKGKLSGTAWVYGDNVDTDVIIPARYLSTSEPEQLAPHCMEDIDASFASSVKPGDIIAAGSNFGCGSSREHAPIAIKACGVSCVIAASYARIFYRNAINIGLPILECPEASVPGEIGRGDELEVDIASGVIENKTSGRVWQAAPSPLFLRDLFDAGGLVPYVRKRLEGAE
ncbi:MAG: 3-isopropylmalate dehydratase small subunit [Synergistaceae bacterium]|jgi:3-isopropylmalate dehydratase small subunit|nr:3-isopropylmalate dehydratase small subunit [Synergistaceae bacterium]